MTSNGPRKGSAEKSIPHTRIADDDGIKESYDIGRKLGEGSFGKVYFATSKTTGLTWAIKSVNKEKAGSNGLKLLEREVSILKRVKHPNIIKLNEVIESNKRMYLVTAVCEGGELNDFLKTRHFTESETKIIMKKLADATAYLHKNDIVHRDLKLENILLSQNPDDPDDKLHIQVTDFGLSVVKDGVGHDNMMQDVCGTPIYMAPEIIDNKTYSQSCDVWAMGVIMYMLLCGNPPFNAADEQSLYELIKKAEVSFEGEIWTNISLEAKSCIKGMLCSDPAYRRTAGEVLCDCWITGESPDSSRPNNVLLMMREYRKEQDKTETAETTGNTDMDSSSNSKASENGTSSSKDTSRKGSGSKKTTVSSSSATNVNTKNKTPVSGNNPVGGATNSSVPKTTTGSKVQPNNVKTATNFKAKSNMASKPRKK